MAMGVREGNAMQAYLGDDKLKAALLEEMRKHREMDMLVRGTYGESSPKIGGGEEWHGCGIACSLRSLDIVRGKPVAKEYNAHNRYPDELGIPLQLAYLKDRIFERLTLEEAMGWPERFAQSIQAGADLSLVWPRFAVWLLSDRDHGTIRYARSDRSRDSIEAVVALFRRWIDRGERPPSEEWRASYAADAASYASYASSYASSYAADAAADAADAAAAASYAYASSYAADARRAHWSRMADKLVELIRAAPMAVP